MIRALALSFEDSAAHIADHINADGYLVVQAATANLAHGPVDLAELSITIRYLIP